MEELLEDAGCVVVGPFARVADTLVAARTEEVDVALLDVNIAGEPVFPVAFHLEERGVPFLFVTGYGQIALPKNRPDWEAEAKPFRAAQLTNHLTQTLKEGRQASSS